MATKLFSLLMSGFVLVQSFNITFGDIVQLDELIEHARYHSEEYGDNMLVFISKHYGDLKEQHHHEQKEEKRDHEELPFQNFAHSSPVTAIVSDIGFLNGIDTRPTEHGLSNFQYRPFTSSPHTKGLLQPPQFV